MYRKYVAWSQRQSPRKQWFVASTLAALAMALPFAMTGRFGMAILSIVFCAVFLNIAGWWKRRQI